MKYREIAETLGRYINRIVLFLEKLLCYNLVFVITPCFYIFEMIVVRPTIFTKYDMGLIKQTLHIIWSAFCFVNIVGNMIFCIVTDTKVNVAMNSDIAIQLYCDKCKIHRPPKAWHCKKCNICILRRDHHCFFFSRCIGLRNHRYYVQYLGYLFISMVYSLYYNYYYVVTKFGEEGMVLSAFRVINPFLRYLIPEPMGIRDLYVLFLFLNMGLVIWSGGLFCFHMMNVLRGLTAHEYRKGFGADWKTMKRNFVSVFGVNWYRGVLWPFIDSPLPEDVEMKYQ